MCKHSESNTQYYFITEYNKMVNLLEFVHSLRQIVMSPVCPAVERSMMASALSLPYIEPRSSGLMLLRLGGYALRIPQNSRNFLNTWAVVEMSVYDSTKRTAESCVVWKYFFQFSYRKMKLCEPALEWRHNERDGVSNHRRLHCLLNYCFLWEIHKWPVDSPHKGPVTRNLFLFDDVIIRTICHQPLLLKIISILYLQEA